jgi:hypothetical protein
MEAVFRGVGNAAERRGTFQVSCASDTRRRLRNENSVCWTLGNAIEAVSLRVPGLQ